MQELDRCAFIIPACLCLELPALLFRSPLPFFFFFRCYFACQRFLRGEVTTRGVVAWQAFDALLLGVPTVYSLGSFLLLYPSVA